MTLDEGLSDNPLFEVESVNVYDAIDLGRQYGNYGGRRLTLTSERLFGNSNIGNQQITNLQSPGRITYGRCSILRRWYARTNLPTNDRHLTQVFNAFAHSVVVTLQVGQRIRWKANLSDLLEAREQPGIERWPLAIGDHTNISAHFECMSSGRVDALLRELHRPDADLPILDSVLVWIHLEGLAVPVAIFDQVFEQIVIRETDVRTTEMQIAAWITTMAKDANGVELTPIADGVLEGRWRGAGLPTEVSMNDAVGHLTACAMRRGMACDMGCQIVAGPGAATVDEPGSL